MRLPRRGAALLVLLAMLAMLLPAPVAQAEEVPRRFPVIFIPGIGGSYLTTEELPPWCLGGLNPFCWYDEAVGYKVWLSVGQVVWSKTPWNDIKMYMEYNDDGTPKVGDSLKVSGVIRDEGGDVYGGYLQWLAETKGYHENLVNSGWLSTFAYDFRKSIDENAEDLEKRVNAVLTATKAQQVILTAHSTGGLIARTYIVNTQGAKVKGLVTIGTPWLGSPLLTKAMSQGWDFGMPPFIFDSNIALMTKNWPGAHALGPGPQFLAAYPEGFLEGWFEPLTHEQQLAHQRSFTPLLYDQVQAWRSRVYNGLDYGVQQHAVAGDSLRANTLLRFRPALDGYNGEMQMTSGDDTVPLKSALVGCDQTEILDPNHTCGRQYIGAFQGHVATTVGENVLSHGKMTSYPTIQATVGQIIDEIQWCERCGLLHLEPFTPSDGKNTMVWARLTNGRGESLANQQVIFDMRPVCTTPCGYVGEPIPVTTDANGWAGVRLGQWVYPSKWNLTVRYRGDGTYSPDSLEHIFSVVTSPKGNLSGVARSTVTGKAVFADIGVIDDTGKQILWLSSDSNTGAFSRQSLPFGDYTLKATTFGHKALELPFKITGGQTTTVGATFTEATVPPPTVTGLSPTAGPLAGGNQVTVTGTALTSARQVYFGSTSVTFSLISDTQLRATAPPGTGVTDVTVTTLMGTSQSSASSKYTYADPPAIAGVAPAKGPATGGTVVTITGSNLTGATAVTFGGRPAAGFTVIGSGEIRATAPAAYAPGAVVVAVQTPSGSASSVFTYYRTTVALTGTVTAAGGAPVAGAKVLLPGLPPLRTGPAGQFVIPDVGEGTYALRVEHPLYASALQDVTVLEGQVTPAQLNLTLRPPDLDGDGELGTSDLAPLLAAFGGPAAAGAQLDLVADGKIDLRDLFLLARDFGPRVAIVAPAPGSELSEQKPWVAIAMRSVAEYRVEVNGIERAWGVGSQAGGIGGGGFVLTEGANTIRVVGTDAAGRTAEDSVSVTFVTAPPPLSLVSPSWPTEGTVNLYPGSPGLQWDGSIYLEVNSDPAATVTARFGENLPVDLTHMGQGLFTGSVWPMHGENTLVITATVGGRTATLTYMISYW